MYEGHSVGAVVPAYNEGETVGDVLEGIPSFVDRIYVVDDASTDDTWSVVRAYARAETGPAVVGGLEQAADGGDAVADGGGAVVERAGIDTDDVGATGRSDDRLGGADASGRIVPIRHEENRGAGGALKTGYRHALDDGLDLVVTVDADGQMDPTIMDRFLDPLVARKRAFAKGDRLASAEHRAAMPRVRLLGNWMLTYLTRVASGYWTMRDPQNGYTAITHDALAAIDVDALPEDHNYCNDLFARLQVADVTVVDVPMQAVYGEEESTIRLRSFVPRTSKTLLTTFSWRLRRQYLRSEAGPSGRVREGVDGLRARIGGLVGRLRNIVNTDDGSDQEAGGG